MDSVDPQTGDMWRLGWKLKNTEVNSYPEVYKSMTLWVCMFREDHQAQDVSMGVLIRSFGTTLLKLGEDLKR